MTSAMLTDHYELTMIDAALAQGSGGVATRRAIFEAYFRKPANSADGLADIPGLAEYALMAGTERIVSAVAEFRFADNEIAYLRDRAFLSPRTVDWLADYHFTGDLVIADEGALIDPNVPALTIRGPFAEAVALETLLLSILNADVSIATRARQFRQVAGPDAVLIEMGSRRIHELHAIDAAHAAIVGGFNSSSNLAAGMRYGVPTSGTAAHAWTLAHGGPEGEATAFRTQIKALGVDTTLLVDTFDIPEAISLAVDAAHEFGASGPGAIRIDSGDLLAESRRARALLDELGATTTKIVVSGDLDVARVASLTRDGAPIDVFGIGTQLVATPPLGFVYKLVAIESPEGALVPVAKRSATPGKETVGGEKTVVTSNDGRLAIGNGPEARPIRIRNGDRVSAASHNAVTHNAAISDIEGTRTMTERRTALIAVDLQNDFCEQGSLAVSGGRRVAGDVAELMRDPHNNYSLIVTTRDWHSKATSDHFPTNGEDPNYATTWPFHCMAGTTGADYDAAITAALDSLATHNIATVEVLKGQSTAAYSGFEGTSIDGATLAQLLEEHGISDVDVVGLATDYCVKATALDAKRWANQTKATGRVRVLLGLCAAVAPETEAKAIEVMRDARIDVVSSTFTAL